MNGSRTTNRPGRERGTGLVDLSGGTPYLGWSWAENRPELMDLGGYLDSLREGMEGAQRMLTGMYQPMTGAGYGAAPGRRGRTRCRCGEHHGHDDHHGHDHDHDRGHRHDHDHDGCCEHEHRSPGCGCHDDAACGCECCVEDADIVVYAHCGEVRVIPVELANETRKDRPDVSVEVSDVRTAGGTVLPWEVRTTLTEATTLEACGSVRFEVLVRVACEDDRDDGNGNGKDDGDDGKDDRKDDRTSSLQQVRRGRLGDVDSCVVGYFSLRMRGCVTRPVVVAVAALPLSCDRYRATCDRGCC